MLLISPQAKISPLAEIEDSVRWSRIVIEESFVIDSFVKIKPVGGTGDVVIGAGTHINSGCVLDSGNGIKIGRGVLLATNRTIAPINHEFQDRSRSIATRGFMSSHGGVVIEDDVWLGANCVVLDGALIENGSVIGGGSVVQGKMAAYAVMADNPLREIGRRK